MFLVHSRRCLAGCSLWGRRVGGRCQCFPHRNPRFLSQAPLLYLLSSLGGPQSCVPDSLVSYSQSNSASLVSSDFLDNDRWGPTRIWLGLGSVWCQMPSFANASHFLTLATLLLLSLSFALSYQGTHFTLEVIFIFLMCSALTALLLIVSGFN